MIHKDKEIGEKVGGASIGTPLFMIDGQIVRGANMPQIEKILGVNKSESALDLTGNMRINST